jgi:hypothetical protein
MAEKTNSKELYPNSMEELRITIKTYSGLYYKNFFFIDLSFFKNIDTEKIMHLLKLIKSFSAQNTLVMVINASDEFKSTVKELNLEEVINIQ